jgi:hypothetical protein
MLGYHFSAKSVKAFKRKVEKVVTKNKDLQKAAKR